MTTATYLLRIAREHGFTARMRRAYTSDPAVVVELPWVNLQGNHGVDVVTVRTIHELRNALGY